MKLATMLAALRWTIGLAWLLLVGLVLVLPGVGFTLGTQVPPRLPADWKIPLRHVDGDRVLAGTGRRTQVGRIAWVDLAGTPEEIGAAHGVLLQDCIAGLEGDLVGTLIERVPGFVSRHVLLGLVGLNNRSLSSFFHQQELREIHAATAAPDPASDVWRCLGPAYQRAVNYHALHDVSQYLIDNPLVRPIQVGCSAFAVGGAHSADGHLIVGRLFDFEGGPRFDADKVVFTIRPTAGFRFIHVAWAGLTGAVTGFNERGLWVSINAAATTGQGFSGRPIVMAVREILQTCAGIDEAVAVLRRTPVFVSDGVLLASAGERRAVVVELGPTGLAVRSWDAGMLISTNHFLDPQWVTDTRNQDRIARGTTATRMLRLHQLLEAEPLNPERAVAVLRDHRGLGGADVGFNNRSTVNAWIGAHLAVADLDRGIIWVSEPDHGLGAMRAFDLDGPRPADDLPADPELARCHDDLPRWVGLRRRLVAGIANLDERRAAVAELVRLNPDSFESLWLAGLAATGTQRTDYLNMALQRQPAYADDVQAITKALAGAQVPPGDPPAAP